MYGLRVVGDNLLTALPCPDAPCMVYLPTFGQFLGQMTPPKDGKVIHHYCFSRMCAPVMWKLLEFHPNTKNGLWVNCLSVSQNNIKCHFEYLSTKLIAITISYIGYKSAEQIQQIHRFPCFNSSKNVTWKFSRCWSQKPTMFMVLVYGIVDGQIWENHEIWIDHHRCKDWI